MVPLWVCAASLPAGLRPALSTTTGLALAAERSALMKRRAFEMPSRYTMMLWVCWSLARKSSTWAMSTAVFGPSDTTVEKPTALLRAQSSIDEVSAPDCDTSASEPLRASGPSALALSCSRGRCSPRPLGPSSCTPSRRAMRLSSAASRSSTPAETTSAARQPMRPATSSAAVRSWWGRAMMARSARVCARSASVPLVWMSRKARVPAKRWARSASRSVRACGVSVSGASASPASTTMDSGARRGER